MKKQYAIEQHRNGKLLTSMTIMADSSEEALNIFNNINDNSLIVASSSITHVPTAIQVMSYENETLLTIQDGVNNTGIILDEVQCCKLIQLLQDSIPNFQHSKITTTVKKM